MIGATLLLGGAVLLFSLGYWQLQRLIWKEDMISKLSQAYASSAHEFIDFEKLDQHDFLYGKVEGLLLTQKALLLGPRVKETQIGHDLIVPLIMKDQRIVLVNMGWTNAHLKNLSIDDAQNAHVSFVGLTRFPTWNIFTPKNMPDNNVWIRPDIEQIAEAKNLAMPLPVFLYAQSSSFSFKENLPNHAHWYPRNKHTHYAIFWFFMTVIFISFFGWIVFKTKR